MHEAKRSFSDGPRPRYAESQTDALVIVTEWKEFRSPDFDTLKCALELPVVFDGHNIYRLAMERGMGFECLGIAR